MQPSSSAFFFKQLDRINRPKVFTSEESKSNTGKSRLRIGIDELSESESNANTWKFLNSDDLMVPSSSASSTNETDGSDEIPIPNEVKELDLDSYEYQESIGKLFEIKNRVIVENKGYTIRFENSKQIEGCSIFRYININNHLKTSFLKEIIRIEYMNERATWYINWGAIDKEWIIRVLYVLPNKTNIWLTNFNKINKESTNVIISILTNFFSKDERTATPGNIFSVYPWNKLDQEDELQNLKNFKKICSMMNNDWWYNYPKHIINSRIYEDELHSIIKWNLTRNLNFIKWSIIILPWKYLFEYKESRIEFKDCQFVSLNKSWDNKAFLNKIAYNGKSFRDLNNLFLSSEGNCLHTFVDYAIYL